MEKTIVKAGQSWWDVGIEVSGAWEAGIDLAHDLGLSMTDAPPLVELRPTRVYNPLMQRHCHREGISPATLALPTDSPTQIFSSTFDSTFI